MWGGGGVGGLSCKKICMSEIIHFQNKVNAHISYDILKTCICVKFNFYYQLGKNTGIGKRKMFGAFPQSACRALKPTTIF